MSDAKSTSFSHLLDTNHIPTEKEVFQLRSFVAEPHKKLSALQARIQGARTALDAMIAQESALQSFVSRHEALLHPIRRMPRDVLQEIFFHCLATEHYPTVDWNTAPLLLTRVCRDWRVLALDTTSLWFRLHIAAPEGPPEHLAYQFDRIDRFITAAKTRPLSLSIWTYRRFPRAAEEPFLRKLEGYTNRVRTLALEMREDFLVTMVEYYSASAWPMLHEVEIVRAGHWENQGRRYGNATGQRICGAPIWRAPALKRVVWNCVNLDFPTLPLRWGQMEEIGLWTGSNPSREIMFNHSFPYGVVTPSKALSILRASNRLVRLKIRLADRDNLSASIATHEDPEANPDSTQEDSSVIVLPHLTTLDLSDAFLHPKANAPVLLEHLELPSLQNLRYYLMNKSVKPRSSDDSDSEDTDEEPVWGDSESMEGIRGSLRMFPPWDNPPLLPFLRAQVDPVRITRFAIRANCISRRAFLECLKFMPLLQDLYVQEPEHTSECFNSNWERWDGACVECIAPTDTLLSLISPKADSSNGGWSIPLSKLEFLQFDCTMVTDHSTLQFVELRKQVALEISRERGCDPSSIIAPLRRFAIGIRRTQTPFVPRSTHFAVCALEEDLRLFGIPDVIVRLSEVEGTAQSSDYSTPQHTAMLVWMVSPNAGIPGHEETETPGPRFVARKNPKEKPYGRNEAREGVQRIRKGMWERGWWRGL